VEAVTKCDENNIHIFRRKLLRYLVGHGPVTRNNRLNHKLLILVELNNINIYKRRYNDDEKAVTSLFEETNKRNVHQQKYCKYFSPSLISIYFIPTENGQNKTALYSRNLLHIL
jgi:adenylate kinase